MKRAKGIVVHLFCGKARKAFEGVAEYHGLVHIAVDAQENFMSVSTCRILLQAAIDGKLCAFSP